MSQENDPKDGFKVVDRRRFTAEGESSGAVEQVTKQVVSEQKQKPESPRPKEQTDKIDFVSFVVSLGTQALVMLGEMPSPDTRLPAVNLEAAKQTIDILGLLEEKTKGNLTPEEEKLLSEILATLRMAFVKKVNK